MGPYQLLSLRVRVDLEVIALKGLSTFPKAPALREPHHQEQFSAIWRAPFFGGGSYPPAGGTVSVLPTERREIEVNKLLTCLYSSAYKIHHTHVSFIDYREW